MRGQLRGHAHLLAGWATVLAFALAGDELLGNLDPLLASLALFAWILGVILWCAFGVIEQADALAELLGEPLGTLVLTFSIVVIEVMLISAVMLSGDANPTVGRDTMFAVMMIVLNGVVGLGLLVGGLRHGEQSYNLPGAAAYLAVIVPLSVIALVLPDATARADGTLTTFQAIAFSLFTIGLYGVFLAIQTGRHRGFFVEAGSDGGAQALSGEASGAATAATPAAERPDRRAVARHTLLLVLSALPIVLLSRPLARVVDHGISALDAPVALSGVLIALIVFTPEAVTALQAAYRNELQRMVNLCLGAFVSTVGLTVPAILMIGLVTGKTVVLGLDPSGVVLIALTLLVSMLTFSGPRTTVLEGAVHLLLFLVYLTLVFSP
ncbi:calcium:proton antiporter [Conexibacter woesei]|uniref:Sodium/calcium exchanger membrane region n=1 Tax=Conexibacter woesei (strain DSM 14684 / CCUG 47730 / CIP 108061 / JCM 11494 / NBRC 100937 / ID131577) TaxID=469383 RepID=D3F1N9_CONWI|nr:calcium:proton antiporter [Conexibacter woesei]ADB54070.1 sodium/calcium exchanger membrane region [Conexibacter woesei DSM 14684]